MNSNTLTDNAAIIAQITAQLDHAQQIVSALAAIRCDDNSQVAQAAESALDALYSQITRISRKPRK